MANWRELSDDGVRLEPLRRRHAAELFALIDCNRAHLQTWLPWVDAHTSIENTRSLIEAGEMQQALDNGCIWGVRDESGVLAGVVDLQWVQWQHLAGSLGYWLGGEFQGRGLMTRALRLLCHFVFEELELNRLELSVACENERSLALVRRVGFIEEGRRRDYERLHGRFLDHVSLAMLARDFFRAPFRLPS